MQDDPTPSDDAALMARLAEGDTSTLGDLVRRHQRRALEIAFRTLGDRAMAEDIAQEAFLRIWRSADRYEPNARFTTWLYRIVVNLCLDAIKKRKALVGELQDLAAPRTDQPSAGLEGMDRAAAVRHAVERLPDRQRVAVVLHRFSGLSIRETSQATGWSESAVESMLVRAYASLRQALRDVSSP